MDKLTHDIYFPENYRSNATEGFPTPEELGIKAQIDAELLAAKPEMNFYAVWMHMGALTSVLNRMDEQAFNRLPSESRSAAQRTYSVARSYLASLGLDTEVIDEFNSSSPDGITDYEATRIVLNKVRTHVSIAANHEERRKSGEIYRGLVLDADNQIDRSLRPHEDVVAEQRSGEFPYDEDGIRSVLRSFGDSFGAVITGRCETAPLNLTHKEIVAHASGCLNAACPPASSETKFSDYI